jgi:hypothetical protein
MEEWRGRGRGMRIICMKKRERTFTRLVIPRDMMGTPYVFSFSFPFLATSFYLIIRRQIRNRIYTQTEMQAVVVWM